MAIYECKECGADVSDKAGTCPKCGVPAPTTLFSDKSPKCIIDGCYNLSGVREKHNGMCFQHYEASNNKNSIFLIIIFAIVVLGIGSLF